MKQEQDRIAAKVRAYLKARTPVLVYPTDESIPKGVYVWAVCVKGTDFWLNAFETRDEAIAFCEAHGLPYSTVKE